MTDLCDHVAAVLHPLPTPKQVRPRAAYEDAVDAVLADREATAGALRAAMDGDLLDEAADEERGVPGWATVDPVLASIAGLRAQQRAADAKIRRLLAYAREFHRPQPYKLSDLADAARLSISGVRTAYSPDEIAAVAAQVKLQPRSHTA
jgi:hypothetical protein